MRLHLLALLCALAAAGGYAQRIRSIHCISEIQARFAITDFLSVIENDDRWADRQVEYEMFLPERAFISGFSIEMNGVVTRGQIQDKDAARLRFEEAVRNGEAAGHIDQSLDNLPRETKKFLIKVNVPKGGAVNFNLTYQEMLARENGVYKHIINVKPRQPVDDVQVDVLVAEKTRFRTLQNGKKVHVPEFRDDIGYLTNDQLLNMPQSREVEIRHSEQQGGSLAYIYLTPTQQRRVNGQVVVLFDIERGQNGGTIQTYDGYFLQTIAPENLPVGNKNVVFVIDKSGSMKGRKIAQVKKAMETILDDLHDSDQFNVIMFSKDTQAWVDTLVPANPHNRQQAKNFIQQSVAKGGTNIYDSIAEALNRLGRAPNSNPVASMVIFLTDGQPTVGKKDRNDIVQSIRQINRVNQWSQDPKYQIHCIGFGNNADMPLMQQIAGANDGVARRVTADADADVQLKGVFQQFSSPKLRDVQIQYLGGGVDIGSLVRPDDNGMFFDGGEVVVAGKLNGQNGRRKRAVQQVNAVVTGQGRNGKVTMNQKSFNGADADCYPSLPSNFKRPDGSMPREPKYLVVCGQQSSGSGNINAPTPPTTTTTTTTQSSPFGALGGRLCRLFGGRFCSGGGRRGKRQSEQTGPGPDRPLEGPNSVGGFIERTYVYMTINKLTKESEEWLRPEAERREKRQRAIDLSLKYGFVTRFTSMVVVHNRNFPNNNNNNNNELMDVPQGFVRQQSDVAEGGTGNVPGKMVINQPSRDGKCRAGVVLVVDTRAGSELAAQQRNIERLVRDMQRGGFESAEFTVAQIGAGGNGHIRLSASSDARAISSAVAAAARGDACNSGCSRITSIVPYLVRKGNPTKHKSFVIFTSEDDSLGALGGILRNIVLPKVVVPTHGGKFAAKKQQELLQITTENQILYSADMQEVMDLLAC